MLNIWLLKHKAVINPIKLLASPITRFKG